MQIYISKNGQRYGPYSRGELQEQIDAGVFEARNYACCDSTAKWIPIGAIPGIRVAKTEEKARHCLGQQKEPAFAR